MPSVALPGVDLWYKDCGGSGRPVLFLHAASGTCDSWVYQEPVFTAAGYALLHPQRVRSLVVASSIGGVQDPAYLEVQHRLRPPEIQALPVELRELGPSYRPLARPPGKGTAQRSRPGPARWKGRGRRSGELSKSPLARPDALIPIAAAMERKRASSPLFVSDSGSSRRPGRRGTAAVSHESMGWAAALSARPPGVSGGGRRLPTRGQEPAPPTSPALYVPAR